MMKLSKKAAKVVAVITGAVALGTVATIAAANTDSIYTTQAGDTFSEIPHKLSHDLIFVDTLANNNNIVDKNLIYADQQLVIKDSGEATSATQEKVATLPATNAAPQITPVGNQTQQNQQIQPDQEASVIQQQIQTSQTRNVQ